MAIATSQSYPSAQGGIATEPRRRRVSILGATGSIGQSTLSVIDHVTQSGEMDIEIVAVTAHSNVEALIEIARRSNVRFAAIGDPDKYDILKDGLCGTGIACGAGASSLIDAAAFEADWVMAAIVGIAGLAPTLAAARTGADVALANKECLVSAGPLLLETVAKAGGRLLPVDSEHNAIFQVLESDEIDQIDKLILTASGGPFRTTPLLQLAQMTPEEAVLHPNWDMGAKISVDSATMMNKGLELIEAAHLFPIPEEKIEVLVHPQSVVHSLVAYKDGSTLAQLGSPDMRTPIAYTLAWPKRVSAPSPPLDLAAVGNLSFETPDSARFPALGLAREAYRAGSWATTVLNAANEVAVAAFLGRQIGFTDIVTLSTEVLATVAGDNFSAVSNLESIMAIDEVARQLAIEKSVRG